MANYAADSTYSVHGTAEDAADGLEALLEAAATTLTIRFCAVVKIHDHKFVAILTTSDATV